MTRIVVDTNVPIVANGRPDPANGRMPSLTCRAAAIRFLMDVLDRHKLLVDLGGEVQAEYRRHLNPSGEPGVGDRFYQELLNSSPKRIERVELPKRDDGQYVDIPQALIDAGFDPSDRKFVALAARESAPVANATDSDWIEHLVLLSELGIRIRHICGQNMDRWFE